MCSLVYVTLGGGYCSGVLVAENSVLTAAHCFNRAKFSDVKIYIGDRLRGMSAPVEITSVFMHAGWTGSVRNGFDLALIRLKEPQPTSCVIYPQYFPDVNPIDGDDVIALGYGVVNANNVASPDLKQAALKIAERGKTLQGNLECVGQDDASSQVICAVSPGYPFDHFGGTCGGDSGGPLIKMVSGTYSVIGLNSYSSTACSSEGNVDKFARIFTNRNAIFNLIYRGDGSMWRRLG